MKQTWLGWAAAAALALAPAAQAGDYGISYTSGGYTVGYDRHYDDRYYYGYSHPRPFYDSGYYVAPRYYAPRYRYYDYRPYRYDYRPYRYRDGHGHRHHRHHHRRHRYW